MKHEQEREHLRALASGTARNAAKAKAIEEAKMSAKCARARIFGCTRTHLFVAASSQGPTHSYHVYRAFVLSLASALYLARALAGRRRTGVSCSSSQRAPRVPRASSRPTSRVVAAARQRCDLRAMAVAAMAYAS